MKKIILILFSSFLLSPFLQADSKESLMPTTVNQETIHQEIQETPSIKNSEEKTTEVEEKNIYLNFENTSLNTVVNYMAELKKINLISHNDLEGAKVSLSIAEPLSISSAWKVFLTLLEVAGFTIVLPEHSNVYRIVKADTKLKEPLPLYINVPAETLPDSDLTIRYVNMLTNVTTDMVKDLLSTLLSPNALQTVDIINGFVITDKAYNIKSAMRVIQELDQTGLKEEVSVIKLERANARDVKDTLMDLMNTKDKDMNMFARMLGKHTENNMTYFSQGTKIIAEERGNRLILLGTKNSIERIITFVTTYLDTEIKEVESPIHTYELQYAEATQIKEILDSVVKIDSESPAAKVGGIRAGVKYFRPMSIKADPTGNRLIVLTTDKQDWHLLKKTIQDLDKAQPQIAIETLIVSVDLTNNKQLGGALRNRKNGTLGKDINFQANPSGAIIPSSTTSPQTLLGNMISVATNGLAGTTAFTLGSETNIWAAFKAFKEQTNTSVISSPFITVTNRVSATVSVGSTLLVEDTKAISGSVATTGKTPQDAATKITYTPQINLDGLINLKINAQIKEFTATSGENAGNYTEKLLNTNVTVANGQVLVLGGFIKTKVDENSGETPGLSKIPLLGWFFKNKKRSVNKNYIFFFISPTLIKPRTQPGMELYTKMKLHEATDYVEETIETKKTRDPLFNWFFNSEKESYSHKIVDYANARYQPTTVDIEEDTYYRTAPKQSTTKTTEDEKAKERAPEIHLSPPETKPSQESKKIPINTTPIPPEKKDDLPKAIKTVAAQNSPHKDSGIKQRNRLKNILAYNANIKAPQSMVSAA